MCPTVEDLSDLSPAYYGVEIDSLASSYFPRRRLLSLNPGDGRTY